MASIATSSASVSTCLYSMKIKREKIVETGKKVFSQISSLVSVITTNIKDAGVAVVSAIRSIEVDHLKESLGIFDDWFWFLSSIFALKFADTGKALVSANNSVLMAMFLIRFISFLTTLLATLFQMHKIYIAPHLLMLVLESGVTILAASLFSGPRSVDLCDLMALFFGAFWLLLLSRAQRTDLKKSRDGLRIKTKKKAHPNQLS